MKDEKLKDCLRGNPKLKAVDYKEYVSQDVLLERLNEIKKIMDDPIYFAEKYFYIVTTDNGKQLIKTYPKQRDMINAMCNKQRTIVLSARQVGKSTSYTVFCLWYCLTNKDKSILICANKFSTAKDILSRIKLAYEELPQWLKPGLTEWNRAAISFENGCKISAEATSGNSGRGGSINCLVVDEFAFLPPNIEEEFLQSVFPVVSSSKTSKIIVVSTPHGMSNEFYRIWNRATLDLDDEKTDTNLKWFPIKIDWYDFPGRDEKWYQTQVESFGGNMARFNQEYGCSFIGSSETLIQPELVQKYKDNFSQTRLKGTEILLNKDYLNTKIRIYHSPIEGHAYIIGADPSMGLGSDYQSMCVFDITNTYKIQQVAGFYENNVPPKIFAYIIAKTGLLYNNAFVAMENNGCSQVTLDALWRDFEYDSIVCEGSKSAAFGICSTNTRKAEACLNFKLIIEDPLRTTEINDGRLINEMEKFERVSKIGKLPTYQAVDGHDDYMMSAIWAFFSLKLEILERYYDIKKYVFNKLGEQMPLFVLPFVFEYQNTDIKQLISEIDEKLNLYTSKSEKYLNQIQQESNSLDIDKFIKANDLTTYKNDEETDDSFTNKSDDDTFGFSIF